MHPACNRTVLLLCILLLPLFPAEQHPDRVRAATISAAPVLGQSHHLSIDERLSGLPLHAEHHASLVAAMLAAGAAAPTLSQKAYLKASNTDALDQFGSWRIAIAGDTVVVGAWQEDSRAVGINGDQTDNEMAGAGAAYVFVRTGTTWSQQAYLKASNTGAGDAFGATVAISGDTIVVGAPGEASNATGVDGNQLDNSAAGSGAAYVFVRTGTTWSQQSYLKASNTGAGDAFGSVTISGDTIVVGAQYEASGAIGVDGNQLDNSAAGAGAAYVFVRTGTTWSQQAYLKASNTEAGDNFGVSLGISGDTIVAGAYLENGSDPTNAMVGAGAAYVFVRTGTTWSQQAYLKASNTEAGDQFGYSVAVSSDTLVIGARLEASSATGVNGNQSDNRLPGAGAAYVFVRTGTTWSQQAYLKASNTGMQDQFGSSVALIGDVLLVGAPYEDSSATGVNPLAGQLDEGARDSGAAYRYRRSGTTWVLEDYLKASNTRAMSYFGMSIDTTESALVVGSIYESSAATGVNGDQASTAAEGAGAAYLFAPAAPVLVVEQPSGARLVNGDLYDFGHLSVGAASSRVFTIQNQGDADLSDLQVTLDGADASQFSLTTLPTTPVGASGGRTTFTVRFSPTSVGDKIAALRIASNDPEVGSVVIVLTGAGSPVVRFMSFFPLVMKGDSGP
jgi:FG-GAP repeat